MKPPSENSALKPEEALNQRIEFWGKQYTIVGVVTNHHQESLRQDYDAHIFRFIPEAQFLLFPQAGHRQQQLAGIIASVQKQYKNFFPGNPFDYFFLDEHFAEQYEADQQFGQTFGLFAGLAIFVSCLGLLGLAAFVSTSGPKKSVSARS